jgi:predicted DNA-binding transcriptional regulator AlpA
MPSTQRDQSEPETPETKSGYRKPVDIGEVRRSLLQGVDLLHEDDVATMLGVSLQTLYYWRSGRVDMVSPAWVKLGREIYYRRADIAEWIAANTVKPSAGKPDADQSKAA